MKPIIINSRTISGSLIQQADNALNGWFIAAKLAKVLSTSGFKLVHLCHDINRFKTVKSPVTLDTEMLIFLASIGVSERDLVTGCQGNYHLGERYCDWPKQTAAFNFVDGDYGVDFNGVSFHHYFGLLNAQLQLPFDNYSIAAQMAKQQRFCHPSKDKNSVFSTFSYSINVDLYAFLSLLSNLLANSGGRVDIVEQEVKPVVNGEGVVTGITSQNSQNTEQQQESLLYSSCYFYLDCSGDIDALALPFEREQLGKTVSCLRAQLELDEKLELVDIYQNHGFAITQLSNSKTSKSLTCYYDSIQYSDIVERLNKAGFSVAKNKAYEQKYSFLYVKNAWYQNVLLLGASSFSAPPIGINDLAILHQDLNQWLDLFPSNDINTSLCNYYNQNYQARITSLSDYINGLLLTAGKVSDANVSEFLLYSLQCFDKTGRLPEREASIIANKDWQNLLVGLGELPSKQDPQIHNHQNMLTQLQSLNSFILTSTDKVPRLS